MSYWMHPNDTVRNDREHSLRAAERYEFERALRTAQEQARAEQKARRKHRVRRYARLVLHRAA